MRSNHSVAAVVVTYNRGHMLLDCLKGIISQKLLPNELFIIDNRSTDNTQELLREHGYYAGPESGKNDFGTQYQTTLMIEAKELPVTYLRKNANDGGAGGFAAGMKLAFGAGYDWIWMMDDDGVPDAQELAELLEKSVKYDLVYANPLVLRTDNPNYLSFGLAGTKLVTPFLDREILLNDLNPFNGTFIRRDVIEKIGIIKKEMFIWGDEMEYTCRVKKAGFRNGTVCTARHLHPDQKANMVYMIPFIPFVKRPLPTANRSWIYYRNRGYINKNYRSVWIRVGWLGMYTVLLGTRFRFEELRKLYKYYFRGIRNDFRNE